MDVQTTFLHGDLDEKIFMEQPTGFQVQNQKDVDILLKKSLYGLKQAPRQWYKMFDTFFIKQGFHRSFYYFCLYYKEHSVLEAEYLLLYIDDMLLINNDKSQVAQLKRQLQ